MKIYHFDLGMYPEEVAQIADGYHADSEYISVYKHGNSILVDFCADCEKSIDRAFDEACLMILADYPELTCEGAAFEVRQ